MKVYKNTEDVGALSNSFVIIFSTQQITILLIPEKNNAWRIYRYVKFIPDYQVVLSSASPSSSLEILIQTGLSENSILTLAQSIPPGEFIVKET